MKILDPLQREGFRVEGHPLRSREETDAFGTEHGLNATPHVFIWGERIGDYEEMLRRLGKAAPDDDATTCAPVIAPFATAAAMALAVGRATYGSVATDAAAERFFPISMCLLALQKLKGIDAFSTMLLNDDLPAQRRVRHGYQNPFGEGLAGNPRDGMS